MLDADALILLLLALLGEHGLPHVEREVINSKIDVHNRVELLFGGDEVEGGIVDLSEVQVSDTGQLVPRLRHFLRSSGGLLLSLALERRLRNISRDVVEFSLYFTLDADEEIPK